MGGLVVGIGAAREATAAEMIRATATCAREFEANARRRRDHGDRADRDGDTDAQGRHDGIRFRIITVLERVIPLIKHLHDGATEANRQNRSDSEASKFHRNASVTCSAEMGRNALMDAYGNPHATRRQTTWKAPAARTSQIATAAIGDRRTPGRTRFLRLGHSTVYWR